MTPVLQRIEETSRIELSWKSARKPLKLVLGLWEVT
jgi:hypothetical protein